MAAFFKVQTMIKLVKPSGAEVMVNEESLAHALSLGWKKATVKKATKRGNSKNTNK